ncbi:MAG TPA: hypothetical protein VK662_07040, partial [Acidothermaceae bacterium]|nr:hypothetical protein [Acidothermaceae bacterium]
MVVWLAVFSLIAMVLAVGALAFVVRDRQRSQRALLDAFAAIAQGDLTRSVSLPEYGGWQPVATAVTGVIDKLSLAFTRIDMAKTQLNTGWHEVDGMAWKSLETTETTAAQATAAARAAEGISESLQLIAAATDELASTIQEVARH